MARKKPNEKDVANYKYHTYAFSFNAEKMDKEEYFIESIIEKKRSKGEIIIAVFKIFIRLFNIKSVDEFFFILERIEKRGYDSESIFGLLSKEAVTMPVSVQIPTIEEEKPTEIESSESAKSLSSMLIGDEIDESLDDIDFG